MNLRFKNNSEVYVRAAYLSADPVRGIDGDMLLVDEFQDVADGHLPVLEEALSHSQIKRVVLAGTPKTVDNHLETVFRQSTAYEFQVPCRNCQHYVVLDEQCLGLTGPMCPQCASAIDISQGEWRARNPESTWGDGFWFNYLMVPWANYPELLERQQTYDLAMFRNECLGLPTALGDHIVTRAELEACCLPHAMAKSLKDVPLSAQEMLVAGIDWGGGGRSQTVLTIGYMDPQYKFVVMRFERFPPNEDPHLVLEQVAQRCRVFRVRLIGADGGGNGHLYNRLLIDKLQQKCLLYAVMYSAVDHDSRQDGNLWRWTVNRSGSIGTLFARVKKQTLLFPRVEESGAYLDEFAAEIAEYDDLKRSIKYTHPETQPDDCLHSTNYALLVATKAFNARMHYS